METEPLGPIMRNKAQAKLSHGNYPHVSSRFEVQTSTKGQPKDQNSNMFGDFHSTRHSLVRVPCELLRPTKPVIDATAAQTKMLHTRAVHAEHVQGTPGTCGAA